MKQDERDAKIAESLDAHADKLRKYNATPVFTIGVAHAPSKYKGRFVFCTAQELEITEIRTILAEMLKEIDTQLSGA